jgi:hypothetical protein
MASTHCKSAEIKQVLNLWNDLTLTLQNLCLVHDGGKATYVWFGTQESSILIPKPRKMTVIVWLIVRITSANTTFCFLGFLPILTLQYIANTFNGRRFEYAEYKQLHTQFTLIFPRTFSYPNSNLTIQPTLHARDFLETTTSYQWK